MFGWNLLAGGAALGLIAGCWSKIKEAAWKLISLFIAQVEIESQSAHDALIAHLVAHYGRSRLYDRVYGSAREHHRDGRYGLVAYERFGLRSVVFWDGWRPFVFHNAVEQRARNATGKTEHSSHSEAAKVHSSLTFLRGTIDVEALLRRACAASNHLSWDVEGAEEQAKNRFVIHYVPQRGDQDEDHDSGSNGLAWYQQSYYRLLDHKPEQLGKAACQRGGGPG